jgi:hypothetical protein
MCASLVSIHDSFLIFAQLDLFSHAMLLARSHRRFLRSVFRACNQLHHAPFFRLWSWLEFPLVNNPANTVLPLPQAPKLQAHYVPNFWGGICWIAPIAFPVTLIAYLIVT